VRLLRLAEVRKRVPYSKATIYRKIDQNEFPRPYSLGARAVAWLESEIDAWIESRIEKQPQTKATAM
jgi:prophage regulatory protein